MTPYPATRMRDDNRRKVFELIRRKKLVTRAMIQQEIAISFPTIMKIVKFFEEKGIIENLGEVTKDGPGRKQESLRFNPEAAYGMGIVFEGHYLHAGIVTLSGSVVYSEQQDLEHTDSLGLLSKDVLVPIIGKLLSASGIESSRILGVGLGLPKIVDTQQRNVHSYRRRDDSLSYRQIANDIEASYGFPLFVENDVNAEAIGEYSLRNFPSDSDLLYLSLGSGIGAGIILNGNLRRGFHFSAGEIGHMVGISGSAAEQLEDAVALKTLQGKWGIVIPSDRKGKDPNALPNEEMTDYLAEYLSRCIADVVAVLDIDLMILGGMVAQTLGNTLITKIKARCSDLLFYEITLEGARSPMDGIIGSAMVAIDNCIDGFLGD